MDMLWTIYLFFNVSAITMSLISGGVEFSVEGENAKFCTWRNFYRYTKLNKATCKTLSFVLNILFPLYNIGLGFVAIIYFLTHTGRDEDEIV